jgi:hypothetical protein
MEKQTFNYDGLFNLSSLRFNTVQGLNLDSGFSFTDWSANERKEYTSIKTTFNYSFQKRLRITGMFTHRFNKQNYANNIGVSE